MIWFMTTAVFTDGSQYVIPNSDVDFFKKLAKKMGWIISKANVLSSSEVDVKHVSWTDDFIGKWQDVRTTEQIINDIHSARTENENIIL